MEELRTIKKCIKGVRSAQRELYETYKHKWYIICLRYLRDRDDANDVLQNALVKIYSNLADFDVTKGKFGAWSSTIVVNECLMFIRKRNGKELLKSQYGELLTEATAATVVNKMTAQEIVDLIGTLPEGYRTIFNMYAIEGYSHKEISEKLEISIGTSKSQLHKARKMLRELVNEMFEVAYP